MGKEDMLLFWGSGSAPCWKVMIALEEKGFGDIEKKLISFSEKGHKSPEVMALNHRGQAPTFKDGDTVVNESMAIMLYLEHAYPNAGYKLLPADPKDGGNVLQCAIEAQENLQMKIVNQCLRYFMTTPADKRDEGIIKTNIQGAKDELAIWEKRVGKFVYGDSFTLADVIVFTYVAVVTRFGLDLKESGFPKLHAYYESLRTRPSIVKSWPPHWLEGELEVTKQVLKNLQNSH